jgi:putative transposase
VKSQNNHLTEEETVTRLDQSHDATEWMQAVLSSDRDLLAEILRAGVQALMEAERDVYVGAGPFERGEGRRAQRNGYKPRTQRTRAGTLELRVPQTRDGGFFPSVLERYQRSEGALISALAECYVQGVSTRKVAAICEELFGERLSHQTVSRYVQELDAELAPWRDRPLEEAFPYLILDARYEKARVDHRIVDVAVLVAIGVSETGHRHVLGVEVAMGETTSTWSDFFGSLLERGLRGVELVVADAHAGLENGRQRHLPGVPWQRCQRHFLMNALEKAPKALEEELHRRLRRIWDESEDHDEARAELVRLAADLAPKHADLAEWLEVEGQETLACFHFPKEHRLRIRTTNGNERVNQELLRRSRVVRIFPNPASALRLATALLKEWHEDWVTGRRYLRMESLAERRRVDRAAA